MIHDIRVAIPIIGSNGWLGGISYIELLVKAVTFLPIKKRPKLFLFVTDETVESLPLHAPILPLFSGCILLGNVSPPELQNISVTRIFSYEELFRNIDLFFPVLSGVWPDTKSASWIPDFQHVFLPQYFSEEELQRRSQQFAQIAAYSPLTIFSSHDAQQSFLEIFPNHKATTKVFPFYSLPQSEWYEYTCVETAQKYSLPDRYVICCNQFWAHKNHPLLLETIAALRLDGIDLHLVCTGATEDYRARNYFERIQEMIEQSGIGDLVHIVGNIPRADQIQLIRRSMAVIQPSLFEGWSTVVEDCRVLGKKMILSNLPVHIEQAPRYGVFFNRNEVDDLKRVMSSLLSELSPGPDLEKERTAREEAYELAERFGYQFCQIVTDAGKIFGFDGSTAPDVMASTHLQSARAKMFPESALAHQLLDGLKGIEIGASAHNPFGLNTRNVGLDLGGYTKEQLDITGTYATLDIVAPADTIPLDDDSEDFVLSSHVIEHCPDMIKALIEWYRVIRKGGYLYIIVPFRDAAPTDKGRPLSEWSHLVDDYIRGVTSETEPEANGIPFGYCHYHVFDSSNMQTFMQQIFDERLQLVAQQEPDDKIGNGFTIVYRKNTTFAESFPWSLCDETRQVTIRSSVTKSDDTGKIVIAANLVPFKELEQRQRQDACIASISLLASEGIVPLNICYPDELQEPMGWKTAPVLKRSATSELKVEGKRKPFVTDLFDSAAQGAATEGSDWFIITNSDIILTGELIVELRHLQRKGMETIAISRNEVERVEADGRLVPGYLEINGYDIFACRTDWWQANRHRFQSYIYGERAWDDAYAAIMACHSRFAMLYTDGLCFHFKHSTSWVSGRYSDHNMRLYTGPDKYYSDRYNCFFQEVLSLPKADLTPSMTAVLVAKHFSPPDPLLPEFSQGFVNIGMITYNRLEFTRQAISALISNTDYYPYSLTVIDNNSQDGTREYLTDLKEKGIIRNLVLLDENVGVAKASNLAWSQEPDAPYYMKLDNDIVMQKKGWLKEMIHVIDALPQIGALGYNFEPVSYPAETINGITIRVREQGNLGGACILIPKRTEKILGCWCEDYGLYGEEDADYGFRIRLTNLLNAYMADEDAGFHLPAGKAAAIDFDSWQATDGIEEKEHAAYRQWKDSTRKKNVEGGLFLKNLMAYQNGEKSIHIESEYVRKINNQRTLSCSILIPLYNKMEYTRQCLEALALNTDQTIEYELILVDNGSTDGTAEYLRTLTGNVTIISNLKNLGFARAMNQAAKLASGRYLVFLNNDTIPHPGWLEALIRGAEQDGADIVGAKLIYPNGRVQHAGVAFDEESIGYHIFQKQPASIAGANRKRFMQCVTAACMLVRHEVHSELNGLDEAYVNGFEDVDFCLRAGARGKKILYTPESVLIHFEETSEGRKSHEDQNMRRYLSHWEGRVRCDDNDLYRIEGYYKEMIGNGRIRLHRLDASQPAQKNPTLTKSSHLPNQGNLPSEHPSNLVEQGIKLKTEHRYAEALELFTTALKQGDSSVHVHRGDCLANLGKFAESESAYRDALKKNCDDLPAHTGLGVLKLLAQAYPEAATAFGKALQVDPANSKALCGLGMSRIGEGRDAMGAGYLKKALDSDPENITALTEVIKCAYQQDNYDEAERYLRNYLMYHPGNKDMLFSHAGLLYKSEKLTEALEQLERLLSLYPDYEGGEELLDKIRREQGVTENSSAATQQMTIGRQFKEMGNYAEALDSFTRAFNMGEESALADMGGCLARLGRLDEAISHYKRALQYDENNVEALIGLGVTSLLTAKQIQAVTWFNKALKIDSSNSQALTGLGMARAQQNKQKEAFSLFSTALESDPENIAALNELLRIAYECNRLPEAEPFVKNYLRYHPADHHILYSLAGLLYRTEKLAEAQETLERILTFEPEYEGGKELEELITSAMRARE
jgi:GT2 family glycosyltransferase/Flp pilus assembly protein TadD/glycosyltransferase involved in cell wall biosynthesis